MVGSLTIDERFTAVHTLTDGTRVQLRLLRPEDRERLREGFERLSPESRFRRFLAPTPRLTEQMLAYLTATDGWNHVAVAAARLAPDGREAEGLGVARFIRLADAEDTAEAAVAVVDDVQGRGLGRLLLATLVDAARERGVRKFRCYVLPSNAPVQALLGELGGLAERVSSPDAGEGALVYDLHLPAAPSDTTSPLYRLFRSAAAGLDVVLHVMGLAPERRPDAG
jgi:GNAT superfamily N-acetyltransferase